VQHFNAMDAMFLYREQPHAPQHIAVISIYDPSTAASGEVSFEKLMTNVQTRLHLARTFRQKAIRVPMDLDLPYWVEDAEFDIEFHMRRITLPPPGDWAQFWSVVASTCAVPLDVRRPLWEIHVVEHLSAMTGIPSGSFATILKVHHAAVDGVAGMEMLSALHDPTADDASRSDPAASETQTEWHPEDDPSDARLLRLAALNAARHALPLAGSIVKAVPAVRRATRGRDRDRPKKTFSTQFNAAISPHRVVDARTFSLAQIKRVKSAVADATVNDVALTLVGGALRRYLSTKGTLPIDPLIAAVPVSIRTSDQAGTAGNEISGMTIALGTHIEDPRERLTAIRDQTRNAKVFALALGARTLTEISALMPGALIGMAARATIRRPEMGMERLIHTSVSNIPGPTSSLYTCGARMVRLHATGPLLDGMALFHVITSYEGTFTVTVFACRETLPDIDYYATCLDDSFASLLAATADETPTRSPSSNQ
jgi:diacylglycerol O-acyltransferase